MTESMDSHGHQQKLSITVTLFVIRNLFYVYESNKCVLPGYVCMCRVILPDGFESTNWH